MLWIERCMNPVFCSCCLLSLGDIPSQCSNVLQLLCFITVLTHFQSIPMGLLAAYSLWSTRNFYCWYACHYNDLSWRKCRSYMRRYQTHRQAGRQAERELCGVWVGEGWLGVCTWVCACMCVCVCACVCSCTCVSVCMHASAHLCVCELLVEVGVGGGGGINMLWRVSVLVLCFSLICLLFAYSKCIQKLACTKCKSLMLKLFNMHHASAVLVLKWLTIHNHHCYSHHCDHQQVLVCCMWMHQCGRCYGALLLSLLAFCL